MAGVPGDHGARQVDHLWHVERRPERDETVPRGFDGSALSEREPVGVSHEAGRWRFRGVRVAQAARARCPGAGVHERPGLGQPVERGPVECRVSVLEVGEAQVHPPQVAVACREVPLQHLIQREPHAVLSRCSGGQHEAVAVGHDLRLTLGGHVTAERRLRADGDCAHVRKRPRHQRGKRDAQPVRHGIAVPHPDPASFRDEGLNEFDIDGRQVWRTRDGLCGSSSRSQCEKNPNPCKSEALHYLAANGMNHMRDETPHTHHQNTRSLAPFPPVHSHLPPSPETA